MAIKAQFNPSTALMHFTDATKRVQVVGVRTPIICGDCLPLPATVEVTISGLTKCCSTDYPFPVDSRDFDDGIFTILNDTFILNQVGPAALCRYSKAVSMNEKFYSYPFPIEDCSGIPSGFAIIDEVLISLRLDTDGLYTCKLGWHAQGQPLGYIDFQSWIDEALSPCWDQTLVNAREASCEDQSGFSPNNTPLAIGGTVVISETP
jgi:hypothetical protein